MKKEKEPKDITSINTSLPIWPEGMNWFQKFLCLYGHHKWGLRFDMRLLAKFPGMKLRDQCDRCNTLR